MGIYSEADLIVPALEIISQHEDGITTADLHTELRRYLRPSGSDLNKLKNRGDDVFSQKVRNLKSHNTFEKRGLAVYVDGRFYIDTKGVALAEAGRGIMPSLTRQGFSEKQRQKAQDEGFQGIVIEEGQRDNVSSTIARRSSILRAAAIKQYADEDGSIACLVCGFRAEAVYGDEVKGLIEIHHTEPLFLSKGKIQRSSLISALQKVVPLCPNCHRTVHSTPGVVIPIEELQVRIQRTIGL
jgi:predicted HNH restriction endonuclease